MNGLREKNKRKRKGQRKEIKKKLIEVGREE